MSLPKPLQKQGKNDNTAQKIQYQTSNSNRESPGATYHQIAQNNIRLHKKQQYKDLNVLQDRIHNPYA